MVRVVRGHIVDPNKPKKYLNAYMLFYLDMRPQLVRENSDKVSDPTTMAGHDETEVGPEQAATKVSQRIGKMWAKLPKTKKNQYLKKAKLGMAKYKKRMKMYSPPSQEELFRKYGYIPKRFVSAYAYFVKRNFDRVMRRHPAWDFVQISKHLGKRWGQLSPAQKVPYHERCDADKRRWNREMHLYREGNFRHNEKKHCNCCHKTGKRRITHIHKRDGTVESVLTHRPRKHPKDHRVNTTNLPTVY